MHRGKIIGAVVLAAAIALIAVERMGIQDAPAPAQVASEAAPVSSLPAPASAGLADGASRVYTIDAAGSEVYWRIYRAGALAALGHNHVISMVDFDGSVTVTSDLAAAGWNLSFPVSGLVIDDPELRARYGEEFESVPSDRDKEGTKTNMLSESLLNGLAFPVIRLTGSGVRGTLDAAQLPVTIEIVGNAFEMAFPASITIDETEAIVAGEYRLTHQQLGLEPYSVPGLGGQMRVGDEIDFSYRIRAVAGGQ